MFKRMGGILAAGCIALALTACANFGTTASALASGLGFGQTQILPSVPEKVTGPAQIYLNKAKVAAIAGCGLVHTYGDAAVLAAQLGVLHGATAGTARTYYDKGVDGCHTLDGALGAAQGVIDAGKTPSFDSIRNALKQANDAAGQLKALVGT
jgi:hypothetical protein